MLNQVALVSQTSQISFNKLTIAAAAIQKQASRDMGPLWGIEATVDAFAALEDVPLGYWQVVIDDTIPFDAAGIHLNADNGQPYALVRFSEDWSLTTSHEVIEMLIDPSGNRTAASDSPKPGQGRVLILVEACDPSEAACFGYTVNGVLVSDFYTPRFFDPVASTGVRYSFSGAITQPRQVLDGGYITWWDPQTKHVFQLFVNGNRQDFTDRGPLPATFGTLRSFSDRLTNARRAELNRTAPVGAILTGALAGKKKSKPTIVDKSTKANADCLRSQIQALLKRQPYGPAVSRHK